MANYLGHEAATRALTSALATGRAHHAWILAGPEGLGKAGFANAATHYILKGQFDGGRELEIEPNCQTARLLAAGSHPDFRLLRREPKDDKQSKAEKSGRDALDASDFRRNITVDQVRGLIPFLNGSTAISERRVVMIDSADELERNGANALLKSLEEPPKNTFFLLISHSPDRLLPTIRSRCRLLKFEPIADRQLAQFLERRMPEAKADIIDRLVRASKGSPGLALRYAGSGMADIEQALEKLIQVGDGDNSIKTKLASELALKRANERYRAFLIRSPSFAAQHLRQLPADRHYEVIEHVSEIGRLAGLALPRSLDPQMVVFRITSLMEQMGQHR